MLFMGACGDSPTDALRDAESIWSYTMVVGEIDDTPEAGDVQCNVVDATLILRGGGTFAGTVDGGLTCVSIGDGPFDIAFSDSVSNGLVDGNSVHFRIGTWQHEGTIADSTMFGSVDVVLAIEGMLRTVAGEWSAIRR